MKTILEIIGGTIITGFVLLIWALVKAAGMASRQEERWERDDD